MKRSLKNALWIVALVAIVVVLIAVVVKVYNVGGKKVTNPDNLVSITEIGSSNYAQKRGNTGYGINVTVDDLGAIKMTGKATGNMEYEICEVTLTPGTTYYLSSGISGQSRVIGSNASEKGYALVLYDESAAPGSAQEYIYADLDGKFTVPVGSADYVLKVIVLKDTNLGSIGKTFKPVLVEGAKAGAFSVAAE